MDTKKDSAVSDVPTFKVARVGKDRKKKGGGLSFLRGGGSRGAWSGATGGSGAGAGAGFAGLGGAGGATSFFASNFIRAMLGIMLAGGLGSAAIYLGAMSAREAKAPAKKSGPFADKGDVKIEGDTSNLPSNANTIPNSLGYLSGSMDGLTAEERAKKAAEAAEAQRLADEEAKKKAEMEAKAAANPAVDPNALLASAKADGAKGPGLGKKFGSLSSSFGGSSLSGGAGMSGGVGRSFGGGSGGSIKGGGSGKLSALSASARPTYSKSGNARAAASNVKGFARKQLANANSLSRQAMAAGKGESAASDAASAFDNNKGAGSAISGPGIGKGAAPSEVSDGSVNPHSTDGGPLPGPSTQDCGSGNVMDASTGVCKPIPKNDTKDDDKYDWMYKTATAIMTTLTILSGLAIAAHALDIAFGIGEAVVRAIGAAMVILGGILVALGVAMIAMTGDKIAGGIIALVGGITAAIALTTPETANDSQLATAALKVFVPTIIGGFAASQAHKPAASQ